MINQEVLIFRTNISNSLEVKKLQPLLNKKGILKWNIDLDDCDHVLRVVTTSFSPHEIIGFVNEKGVRCEEME
jgi:hypothetical protein